MATVPHWHLYRAFLAVIAQGSLSGAARSLGMTQPTVGRQIAALEAALGVSLFTRSLDGLAPTEMALQLLPAAEAMAAAAQAAQRLASGEAADERGTVRFTASEIIGAEVLPPLLARLQARHPGIQCELALSNRNEDLLRGDADIAVRMVRPTQGALVARRIGRIDIGLYAHGAYLKRHPAPERLDALAGHVLIGFDRDTAYSELLQQLQLPITRDAFGFRSDNHLAQLAALRAGAGIGACQIGIARRDRNLVPILHGQWIFPMETWLVMHRDLRASRRVRLAYDHLGAGLSEYVTASQHASRS
jgi:DNA-binding transcriptional LysR family regulator